MGVGVAGGVAEDARSGTESLGSGVLSGLSTTILLFPFPFLRFRLFDPVVLSGACSAPAVEVGGGSENEETGSGDAEGMGSVDEDGKRPVEEGTPEEKSWKGISPGGT